MVKCEFCNNVYYNREKNCTSCGAPLPIDTTPITKNLTPQQSTDIRKTLNQGNISQRNVKSNKKISKIWIIVIIVIVIGNIFLDSLFKLFDDNSFDVEEVDNSTIEGSSYKTVTEENRFSVDDLQEFDKYYATFEENPKDKESVVFLTYYYLYNSEPKKAYAVSNKFIEQNIKDDGEIYIELAGLYEEFRLYGFSYYILDSGYKLTKLESINQYTSLKTLDKYYDNTPEGEVLSLMFGKNLKLINYEDLSKIKAIYISNDSLLYSTEDPILVDGQVENYMSYLENMQRVEVTDTISGGMMFSLFTNMSVFKDYSRNTNTLNSLDYYSSLYFLDLQERNLLEKVPVIENLKGFQLSGSEVAAIGDIDKLTNLEFFGLVDTAVYDITSLANIKGLKAVYFEDNENLKNLDSITQMASIKEISVIDMPIIALNIDTNIISLNKLVIEDTDIKNVDFLANCTSLTELTVVDNYDLKSIPSLSNLTNLHTLRAETMLREGYVHTIDFARGLTNIKVLEIYGNIHDMTSLGTLTGLEELYMYTGILDDKLSDLSNLVNLKVLTLQGSPMDYVVNVSFLNSLTKLERLDLSESGYVKGSELFNLPNLKFLSLGTYVGDFSKVAKLTNLETLILNNSTFMDDIYVGGSNGFYSISYLGEKTINDYAYSVGSLTNLKNLQLVKNDIDNIDFASNLSNLEVFVLADNYITNLEPLNNLNKLTLLNISDNPISNWGNIRERTNLELVGYDN